MDAALISMAALSRSGAIRTSAGGVKAKRSPFFSQCEEESAESKANGPSTMAPTIWPLLAMVERIAASLPEAMPGSTSSLALNMATLGVVSPRSREQPMHERNLNFLRELG